MEIFLFFISPLAAGVFLLLVAQTPIEKVEGFMFGLYMFFAFLLAGGLAFLVQFFVGRSL